MVHAQHSCMLRQTHMSCMTGSRIEDNFLGFMFLLLMLLLIYMKGGVIYSHVHTIYHIYNIQSWIHTAYYYGNHSIQIWYLYTSATILMLNHAYW